MRPMVRFCLLLLLVPAGASAQGRTLDIERFRPAPDRSGYLGMPGAGVPGEWAWDVSLWLNYASDPLTFRRADTGERLPIVAHRVTGDVTAQLGLLDRLALVLTVPVILYQVTDPEPLDAGPAIAATAIRDPYAAMRARLLGGGVEPGHDRIDGEGLAVQAGVTLPFGLEQSFAGEGSPQLDVRVIGEYRLGQYALGAELGYRHRFSEPELLGVRFANEIFFSVALQTPSFVLESVVLIAEVRTTTAVDQEAFLGSSTAVEGDLGARWAEGDFAVTGAVGAGFNGGVGTPGFRGMFGVEFSPRVHDADGDGLVDSEDRCVHMEEDFDGFEDDDGCPDDDNDGDLIPDHDDACPEEAAEFDRDEDEDGCTDPVRDRDDDGVEDDDDSCPDRAEDVDGFQDDDGCPDLDDDNDGVPDAQDRCPREAEDRDGFEDGDGCPDPDNDSDHVPDARDRCPALAEDRDGFEDDDGCPELDNDRDGVLDADDRCPDERETINGVDDDDGCADRGGRARWLPVPDDENDPPQLVGRIRFSSDGGIRSISVGAIDQLARHLIVRSGVRSIVAVPPGVGRAEAVTAALLERGVPEGTFVVTLNEQLRAGRVVVTTPIGAAPGTATTPAR